MNNSKFATRPRAVPALPLGETPAGIYEIRTLPDESFLALWDAIIVDDGLKERLLCQSIVNFTVRSRVPRSVLPLHGIILLVGVPGTGKTSLAKGLATRTAESLGMNIAYLEVDPHTLSSAALGKSQKAVTELFSMTVAEYAAQRATIVLLDEVETLVSDRTKLSLEANPIDVHRATDAALVQLDHLASRHSNLLFIATSNFPQAIDPAFLSRVDLIETIPLPNEEACARILRSTVEGMATAFPGLRSLVLGPAFDRAAHACVGLDGRQIRKLAAAACTFDKNTALDPNRLTVDDLHRAAEHAHAEKKGDVNR